MNAALVLFLPPQLCFCVSSLFPDGLMLGKLMGREEEERTFYPTAQKVEESCILHALREMICFKYFHCTNWMFDSRKLLTATVIFILQSLL